MIKFCAGCDIPDHERVNLPDDWKEGDPLPPKLTIHNNEDGTRFAFRGPASKQDRIPLNVTA